MQTTLATLRVGEKAVILSCNDEIIGIKLLEMGCIPGAEVVIKQKAPLGDPIAIGITGYTLSLRHNEAATIIVEKL